MYTPAQIAADNVDKFQQMSAEMASMFAQGLSMPFKALLIPFRSMEEAQSTGAPGFLPDPQTIPTMFTTSQDQNGFPGLPKPPELQTPQGMQTAIPVFEIPKPDGSVQSFEGPPQFFPQGIQSLPPAPLGATWKILAAGEPVSMPTGFGGMPQESDILNIGAGDSSESADFVLL